jgi:hypothetical protein
MAKPLKFPARTGSLKPCPENDDRQPKVSAIMDGAERDRSSRQRSVDRRTVVRAGALGLMGIGIDRLLAGQALAERASLEGAGTPRARSVIYIFLSGGLSQLDSFDMKPDRPSEIRGPFRSIETRTPGLRICEHLPLLAARSEHWSICRSLTHPYNEHSQGHMVMLSGRSELPAGFDPNRPRSSDWPSMAAIASDALPGEAGLPPVAVLPERLVHRTGRTLPGQFAGLMGPSRDPLFLDLSAFTSSAYGAYPEYDFQHEKGRTSRADPRFALPELTLGAPLTRARLGRRTQILEMVRRQQIELERSASVASFSKFHRMAIEMLTEPSVAAAFDITRVDDATLDRYGRNSFGWSLLMARRLVGAGVRLVQVHLGNNETWDTHVNAFHNLENFLFPPTDRAVSALLDDLVAEDSLDETLVIMAGEFGRTPRISSIGQGHPPGRDHWGRVQTVWFAGGGVEGGREVGSSDADAGEPRDDPQRPENLAATIYHALGIPAQATWTEQSGRPHSIHVADPIGGLF